MSSELIQNNFRMDRLPHIWCPGCGHGIVMRALAQAIENLGYDKKKGLYCIGNWLLLPGPRLYGF